jgi:hypothetical protein
LLPILRSIRYRIHISRIDYCLYFSSLHTAHCGPLSFFSETPETPGEFHPFVLNMGSFSRLSFFAVLSSCASLAVSQLTSSAFASYRNVLEIPTTFDPIIAAYWTGLPHHRRTPFAVRVSLGLLSPNCFSDVQSSLLMAQRRIWPTFRRPTTQS